MGTHPIFESDFDCLTENFKMEITVKNIAQSCSSLLQKYKGRPEKGKICMNFGCKNFNACKNFENLI